MALRVDLVRTATVGADILIVALVLYKVITLIRGTRAISLIKGLAVLFIANLASRILGLSTVYWLLQRTITMVFVALPIVFLPEVRRALEQIGRGRLFSSALAFLGGEDKERYLGEIAKAMGLLAQDRAGAIVVIERETGVTDFIETGVALDAIVSSELLTNIFTPGAPLHDGAVIIRGNRIMAASCYLPLTDNPNVSRRLGTRHRAGLGITEQTDAIAIIVSQETGVISLALGGRLTRHLDEQALKDKLVALCESRTDSLFRLWQRGVRH